MPTLGIHIHNVNTRRARGGVYNIIMHIFVIFVIRGLICVRYAIAVHITVVCTYNVTEYECVRKTASCHVLPIVLQISYCSLEPTCLLQLSVQNSVHVVIVILLAAILDKHTSNGFLAK